MICGGIFVSCVVINVNMRLICDHLFIHICTNMFEYSVVFLNLIDAGVCSQQNYLRKRLIRVSLMERMIQVSRILSHSSYCGCH